MLGVVANDYAVGMKSFKVAGIVGEESQAFQAKASP